MIFTSGLSEGVRLPQPKHTTIVYVQREGSFVAIPPDAPVFDRAIEMYQDHPGWSYWVESASGGKHGAGLPRKIAAPESGEQP